MRVLFSAMTLMVALTVAAPVLAQQSNSSGAQGDAYHTTNPTGYSTTAGSSQATGNQSIVTLPTGFGQLANVPGGLPETRLDSLVAESGYSEAIYGDEGTTQQPPFYGFDDSHYIYHGMSEDTGLTTGHATALPTAWGWTNTMSNGPGVMGGGGDSQVYVPGLSPGYSSLPGYGTFFSGGYGSGDSSGYVAGGPNLQGYSLGYVPSPGPYGVDPGIAAGATVGIGAGVSVGVGLGVGVAGLESGF